MITTIKTYVKNRFHVIQPLIVLVSAFIFLWILAGCEPDNQPITRPTPSQVTSIEIRFEPQRVVDYEDAAENIHITVIPYNDLGVSCSGVSIQIRLSSGIGMLIVSDSTTDEEGKSYAELIVTVPIGDTSTVIEAGSGQIVGENTIQITGTPAPVSIDFDENIPQQVSIRYNDPIDSNIPVRVIDKRGDGIEGINVAFSLLSGQAEFGDMVTTDENGNATIDLKLDGTYFGELVLLAAVIEETSGETDQASDRVALIDTLTINVELESAVGLHFLTPDTTIRLYSGTDEIPIRIALGDEAGNPLSGEIIRFEADSDIIIFPDTNDPGSKNIVTDDAGIATTRLLLTRNSGVASVTASFEPLELTDVMTVEVTDNQALTASIELIDPGPAVWADIPYSVRVAVRYPRGGPGVGVPVRLISELGNVSEQTLTTNRDGIVILLYTPQRGGNERLMVETAGEQIEESGIEFNVIQEPIRITGEFQRGEGLEYYTTIIFPFQMLDSLDQGVPGETISFSATIGVLNRNSVVTDAEGRGEIRIHSIGLYGICTLTMMWRNKHGEPFTAQRSITILPLPPHSIEISMGNLLLEVGDSTIIHVTVRDVLGNLCGQPSTVLFEIINGAQPPAGASFNDGVLIDSTVTSNGVGIIRFNVGQSTDGALIHATTWADEERTQSIEAIFSTGRVYPGPPFGIDIDVNDDGEDAGGGAWSIEVAARVWDRYRNPVRDGTPVYFNVDPIQRNAVAVFTDNGIADFSLIYNSVNTFDPIVVNAWADSPEGEVRSRREHILPLQEGYLELNVEPANWMFEDDTTIAEIRCWVDLKDGHQIEINNAPILFTSNRRALYWYDFATDQYVGFFLDPAIAYTGIVNRQHNEEPGQATIWLRGYYDDLVDWIWPYTPVQINAQVIGYDDVTADPAFIFITRRGGR